MATIVKSIGANPIKNGSARIRLNPGVVNSDTFSDITGNSAIIDGTFDVNMFDDRYDNPRYYTGDAIS